MKRGEISPLLKNLTQAQVELNAALARAEESERDYRHLAQHDQLTGLVNRGRFYETLALNLEQAKRTGRHLAVLLLDLDRFKSVNDSYGHRAGDELLQEVARRLQECFTSKRYNRANGGRRIRDHREASERC